MVDGDHRDGVLELGQPRGALGERLDVRVVELRVGRPCVDGVAAEQDPGRVVEQADAVSGVARHVQDLELLAVQVEQVSVGQDLRRRLRGDRP